MADGKPDRLTSGEWRRQQILQFLEDFVRREGYSPSYREIATALGLGVSTVHYHVSLLERDGSLRHETGRCRAFSSAPRVELDQVGVPLIGRIAAGIPLDAEELVEEIFSLPRRLVGHGKLFMLRVQGHSMSGARIAHGDLAVFRQQQDAENGEIVAAQIERGGVAEATVKTLQRVKPHTWLMPQNPAYKPIQADDAIVLGKLVAVIRPRTLHDH